MKTGRIIALIVAFALMLAPAALAQSTITVQGVGTVMVDSNRAGISLGVREVAEDVMSAQSMVNEKISAIVDALKGMGLTDDAISTNGIGIYPNYSYDDGESIVGYTAYNNIYLTVTDVDNTGAYIDAAFAAGANSLDYVEFSAADTDEAAAQAMALAVESAKAKAKIIAEAAGVTLGDILEIRDSAENGYDGALYVRNVEDGAGDGTGVMAAKQNVTATVSITFLLIQ